MFLPRRKEGEDPNAQRYIRVSYEALEGLFYLPLKEAAHEIGLCPTTVKKACRRFGLEQWPFRRGGSPFARRASQTDGVDATMRTLHQNPVHAPAAPTFQTTEAHQAMRAATVSCTSQVLYDGVFCSAAPQGLFQQASMALDTRSYDEARHAGPALKHFAPFDAPSYIDTLTRGLVVIGVPQPCPSPVWRDTSTSGVPLSSIASSSSHVIASSALLQDREIPLETGPPRERSCVEAVMDYLDLGCSISEADAQSMLSDDVSLEFQS